MKAVYTLEITATCPVDGKHDVYICEVTATRLIPVEEILKATESIRGMKDFQENVCQELHRQLACSVRLIGYHSGVKIDVVCE